MCLYYIDIPEKAREAPNYGPPVRQQPAQDLLASTSIHKTTKLPSTSAPTRPPFVSVEEPIPSSATGVVVPPPRHLTPPAHQQFELIEPPSRYLTPPLPAAVFVAQKKSLPVAPQPDQRRQDDIFNMQPSQFGLRMKHKMRFRRSLADITSILDSMLPHSIQEEFPMNFDHDVVARLVERQIRSKRSINAAAGDNHHHHHHDHHHEEDRGCTILGIHYQLGEVIGK